MTTSPVVSRKRKAPGVPVSTPSARASPRSARHSIVASQSSMPAGSARAPRSASRPHARCPRPRRAPCAASRRQGRRRRSGRVRARACRPLYSATSAEGEGEARDARREGQPQDVLAVRAGSRPACRAAAWSRGSCGRGRRRHRRRRRPSRRARGTRGAPCTWAVSVAPRTAVASSGVTRHVPPRAKWLTGSEDGVRVRVGAVARLGRQPALGARRADVRLGRGRGGDRERVASAWPSRRRGRRAPPAATGSPARSCRIRPRRSARGGPCRGRRSGIRPASTGCPTPTRSARSLSCTTG